MKRVIKSLLCHTAIVTLKEGASFRGVLYRADSEALVLRNVEALTSGGDKVDGELVVLVADVSFIQIP